MHLATQVFNGSKCFCYHNSKFVKKWEEKGENNMPSIITSWIDHPKANQLLFHWGTFNQTST
jgi:hypothetical protein